MAVPVYTPANALTSPDVNQQTNFRVLVKMATASNGQLRVTFRTGGGGSGLGIEGAAVGKWDGLPLSSAACDMTTPPHRLMFAGLVEKLIPPNSAFVTDWVTHSNFSLAAGDWLIVTFKTNYDGYEVYSTGPTNTNVTTVFKSSSTDYSQAQTAAAMGGSVSITGGKQPGEAGGYNFSVDLVETNDPSGGGGKPSKVWNGTSWVTKTAKVWSGSAWVTKPIKIWNGSGWVS
jgi:hypothetical protein